MADNNDIHIRLPVVVYRDEQTLCLNCHRRVRYVDGALGGAWQHIHSMSIYCAEDGELRAVPA